MIMTQIIGVEIRCLDRLLSGFSFFPNKNVGIRHGFTYLIVNIAFRTETQARQFKAQLAMFFVSGQLNCSDFFIVDDQEKCWGLFSPSKPGQTKSSLG